jgi:hypothetical protein
MGERRYGLGLTLLGCFAAFAVGAATIGATDAGWGSPITISLLVCTTLLLIAALWALGVHRLVSGAFSRLQRFPRRRSQHTVPSDHPAADGYYFPSMVTLMTPLGGWLVGRIQEGRTASA